VGIFRRKAAASTGRDLIEVHNPWASTGTPLLVEWCPDLEKILTDPHPQLPLPESLRQDSYWANQSTEIIRHLLLCAYLRHPDPQVRLAALGAREGIEHAGGNKPDAG